MRNWALAGRIALALSAGLTLGTLDATTPANAQKGAWCAEYSFRGGGEDCSFYTLQQCRWAVSGVGGFCRTSQYPVYVDQPRPRRKARRRWQ